MWQQAAQITGNPALGLGMARAVRPSAFHVAGYTLMSSNTLREGIESLIRYQRIIGEGAGGVAGFAKGGAKVRLEEESPDVTILHYEAEAQIGGKLAQLGSRLIQSTAKKLAAKFFKSFAEVLNEDATE